MSKITQNQHGKPYNVLFELLPCQLTKMCKNCRKDIKHINILFLTKNPQNAVEVL